MRSGVMAAGRASGFWLIGQSLRPQGRWADYWQQQAYAVMLVIRTSDGEIRWMDVSA